MKHYYIYLSFKAIKSNFNYSGIQNNIRYKISLDQLSIILFYKSLRKIDFKELHELELKTFYKFSGIGLIMDAITTVTNIILSTDYSGLVFKKESEIINSYYDSSIDFEQFRNQIRFPKLETKISTNTNFYPNIENIEIKFNKKSILSNQHLLGSIFSSNKLNSIATSLLNYWKKAYILFILGYREESFLNYYKILEYFLKKNIPDDSIDDLIEKYSLSDKKIAKRLFESFIGIRNHWDIAHKKIKKCQKDTYANVRDEFFNISSYDQLWEKYDDIKEISRFLIFKYLGIEKIKLNINERNALRTEVISVG